mgnify:FL=1
MKVLIGITTFGPIPRAERLVQSILRTKDAPCEIAIADDSLGGGYNVSERRDFCREKDVHLLENNTISGIPASWNRLMDFGKKQGAEIIVIVSDGVRFLESGWLSRLIYFLENNERVGTVGLPHVSDPSLYHPEEDRYTASPGRVGAAVGCQFAARIDTLMQIENPDGSRGYWTSLLGFHEEISMGLLLCEKGYLSYMISWPGSWYRGGMAFGQHPELIWRGVDPYLPHEEFVYWAQQSRLFVPQYMEYYNNGSYDKMTYSRIMFCKRFGILDECKAGRRVQEIKGEIVDILDDPPKLVHPKVCDIWEPRKVYWLDKDGKERSSMDA